MADMEKLALTAQRLIAANGRAVTVIKYGSTPADPDKPWRGQAVPHESEVTGYAAFVPASAIRTTRAVQGDGATSESEYALFAAEDDTDLDLEHFNVIQDESVIWRIIATEILAPGTKRILYMFEVKR